MLRARVSLKSLRFKEREYRIALEEAIIEAIIRIARVWLREALKPIPVNEFGQQRGAREEFPVQTGMAKAAFKSLAEMLNSQPGQRVAFSIRPKLQTRRRKRKSITQGELRSKKYNTRRDLVSVLRNQYGPYQFRFDWWTNIPHFIENEDKTADTKLNLTHVTPWHAIERAYQAAADYAPTTLDRIPQIIDYLVESEKFEVR